MIQQQSPSASPQIKAKMCRLQVAYLHKHVKILTQEKYNYRFLLCLVASSTWYCGSSNERETNLLKWNIIIIYKLKVIPRGLHHLFFWGPLWLTSLHLTACYDNKKKTGFRGKRPDSQYQFPFIWCQIWKKLSKPPEPQFASLRRERQESLSLAYHEKSLSWVHNMWPEQFSPGYVKRHPSISCRVLAFCEMYFSNCDCRQMTSHSN